MKEKTLFSYRTFVKSIGQKKYRRQNLSFSNKILLCGLLVTLFPISVAGFMILHNERTRLLEQAKRELNIVTQAIAIDLTNALDELQQDSALLAKQAEIRSLDRENQIESLTLHLNHRTRYGQLALIDPMGNIQLTTSDHGKLNISHIESFQKAAAGEQAWVIAPALQNDNLVLHLHTPIFQTASESAEPDLVLGSPVPLSYFTPLLATYNGDMPGSSFVLGSDQKILIHQNEEILNSRPDYAFLFKADNLENAPKQFGLGNTINTQNLIFEEGGDAFVTSITPIEGLGWSIVARKRLSVVLQPLQVTQQIGIVIIVLLSLTSLLVALTVRDRIAKPIEKLAFAASELEFGMSERPLPEAENQIDEIKQLIFAFSNMRKAVVDRETKLHQFSCSLEEKVTQRTAELEQINRHLQQEIRERIETEKELQISRDTAEDANRAKDTFLARMSHELRTPLNAIIGYAEIIQETCFEYELDGLKTLQQDVTSIQKAGRHLLAIINNVLNFSKMQAGKMDLDLTTFSLDNLIDQATLAVKPLIEKNGNKLVVDYQIDKRLILSDQLKLRQILINLMSNAAKFTINGKITLHLSLRDGIKKHRPDRAYLVMKVRDTGIGIREEDQQKLFHPFSQVEETYSRSQEGTGLGLVLTQNFVKLLNGFIQFSSKYGEGTEFGVVIPVRLYLEEAYQPALSSPNRLRYHSSKPASSLSVMNEALIDELVEVPG